MDNGTATFADLLRRFRDRAELTQEELAERAGMSADAVRLLERGARRPHSDTVTRLAGALGLSAAEQTQFAVDAAPEGSPPIAPALHATLLHVKGAERDQAVLHVLVRAWKGSASETLTLRQDDRGCGEGRMKVSRGHA